MDIDIYKYNIYVNIYICIYICIYIYVSISIYKCVYIYDFNIYIYVYICKYIHIYMYIYVYMCVSFLCKYVFSDNANGIQVVELEKSFRMH